VLARAARETPVWDIAEVVQVAMGGADGLGYGLLMEGTCLP